MPKSPDDPTFPHGKPSGYQAGCRKSYPCPATPTCHEAKMDSCREHRRNNDTTPGHTNDTWPQTKMVQRRLRQTLEVVGYDDVQARTGLALEQITQAEQTTTSRVPPGLGERLDHAWSWFVHDTDTLRPGFPHGTSTGFSRCCRCVRCRHAMSRATAQAKAGHTTQHALVASPPGLADHVKRLIDVGGTRRAVAAAADVSQSSIQGALDGTNLRAYVLERLTACTPEMVAAEVRMVPSARPYQQLRSMWALGYPMWWLSEQVGLSTTRAHSLRPDEKVTASSAAAIERVAVMVGDTLAMADGHLTAKTIKQTRSNARRAGHYPPSFYDDDGNLEVRSIPGHPWAVLDDKAGALLDVADLVVNSDLSQDDIGTQTGTSDVTARKVAKKIGMVYSHHQAGCTGGRDVAASTAAIRAVNDVLWRYNDGQIGPVTAACELGLMSFETVGRARAGHPEVAAWRAAQEQPEEDAA